MRKQLLTFVLLVAGALSLSAQKIEVVEAEYQNHPLFKNAMVSRGGLVGISFGMEIPGDYLKTMECVVATPVLINGDYCKILPPVKIQRHHYGVVSTDKEKMNGKEYPEYQGVVDYSNDPVYYHYQADVPFEKEMASAVLVLVEKKYNTKNDVDSKDWEESEGGVCACAFNNGKVISSSGIINYDEFIKLDMQVYYQKYLRSREYDNQYSNVSVFKAGQSVLDKDSFLHNGYLDFIEKYSEIAAQEDVTITDIHITGSASPEGALSNNERLAEARANTIRDFISEDLKIEESKMTIDWIDENWDAFIEIVPTFANSDEIMAIIEEYSDYDKRERELKKLKNWREILDSFQSLRNCRTVVSYDGYDYEEGVDSKINGKTYTGGVIGTGLSHIDESELEQKYSEDPHSIQNANNKMVAKMLAGDYQGASDYANDIPNAGIDPVIANNKGVLYTMLGEYQYAKKLFEKAEGVPGADYNYGTLLLLMGYHEDAAEILGECTSINSIVSSMYVGDVDSAVGKYHFAEESAENCYLGAIAYALSGEKRFAYRALRKAIELDSVYKFKARNQAEFIQYRDDREFEKIIK